MIGSSEVAFEREVLFKLLVAMELGAVVEGDRLETGAMFLDGLQGGLGNGSGGSRVQLFDDGEAGLSFNEGENAVVEIAADHSIAFPMTELQTGFDLRWALRDMPLTRENSA